jgi:recombination protein RecT
METKQDYAIQKSDASLKAIMRSDEIRSRFSEVIGSQNAGGYISSVLIAVAENEALQKCTATSVISSALRAATMRLSVDPSTGQAYLVPFKGKATLIVGWRGIYHMALRTGKYQYINLFKVYEGEEVIEDRMKGIHSLMGVKKSGEVIGYMLSFGLRNGFAKTFYMTVEECAEHGAKYSRTFGYQDSVWKKDPHTMYKKTVMRLGLTRWGYLEPSDLQAMSTADESVELEDIVDSIEVKPELSISDEQAMADLGFGDRVETVGNDEPIEAEFEEDEAIQEPLIPDEPPKIGASDYWKQIKVVMRKDKKFGNDLLAKNGGDFEAAYYEAKKLRGKEMMK